MTYTQRYPEGSRSLSMIELMANRGDPEMLGSDDQGNELYLLPDNTEVILTNAGLVAEGDEGFAEVRAGIVS